MNDDPDDQLGARLDSALRSLDADRVDVATLLQGSRARAQRVRSRRIAAGAAAAVLVICVPIGYEVINPQPGGTAPPAALLPSGSQRAGPGSAGPTPRPAPTASAVPPSPSASGGSASTDVPVGPDVTRWSPIPDAFGFSPAELPAGLAFTGTSVNAGRVLVSGMQCSWGSSDALEGSRAAAGRQWRWQSGNGTAGGVSVVLTVTRWADGEAATVLQDVIDEKGACTWGEGRPAQRSFAPAGVDQAWASTETVTGTAGANHARSLIRIGNGIVGVEVGDPRSVAAAARLADELAVIEAGRLARNPL